MDELEKIFDNILCLCVEGVEFLTRTQLAGAVIKEAQKGYAICKQAQQKDSADLEFMGFKVEINPTLGPNEWYLKQVRR